MRGSRGSGRSGTPAGTGDLLAALAKAGHIAAEFDADGYLTRMEVAEERKGQRLIAEAIQALGQAGR
ncbi:hypothetical protein [Spirillospora sp. CA-128828]|uniref:hypothetical protein n=1 Tax=Spirillospora sp. CA-128828 TaxID=3240033 RepID=UPI003D92EC20